MTTTIRSAAKALKEQAAPLSRVSEISTKVAEVLSDRLRTAHERYRTRLMRIGGEPATWPWAPLSTPIEAWKAWTEYALDTRRAHGALLGHAAPARRRLSRARARRPSTAPALPARDRDGWANLRAPGQLCAPADDPPAGCRAVPATETVHHHRSACRPRPRDRRLQGRLSGRRGAALGPPGVLRGLFPRSGAGPDAARCVRGRGGIRAQGPRAAPRERQARDRRQLPGRMGGDDARRRAPRRHGPHRHQRGADVLLGGRLA